MTALKQRSGRATEMPHFPHKTGPGSLEALEADMAKIAANMDRCNAALARAQVELDRGEAIMDLIEARRRGEISITASGAMLDFIEARRLDAVSISLTADRPVGPACAGARSSAAAVRPCLGGASVGPLPTGGRQAQPRAARERAPAEARPSGGLAVSQKASEKTQRTSP